MMKPLSDTIALEAMANPGALEATFRKLPQLVSYLTSTVTEALTGNRLSKAVLGFFAGNSALRFANRIQNAPYAPLRTLEVPVPQGLTTDLLSYGQALQSAAQACSKATACCSSPCHSMVLGMASRGRAPQLGRNGITGCGRE
jgi:hypothetical protein